MRRMKNWFVLMLNDQQAGYMHSTMERKGNEIQTSTEMVMSVKRAGQELKIELQSGSRETMDGRPAGFDGVMKMSPYRSVVFAKTFPREPSWPGGSAAWR